MSLNLLFLTKLLPKVDIIGGPILIYYRIKNLYSIGHKITMIAMAYTEEDRKDKSLEPFCERIILVDSIKGRSHDEAKLFY